MLATNEISKKSISLIIVTIKIIHPAGCRLDKHLINTKTSLNSIPETAVLSAEMFRVVGAPFSSALHDEMITDIAAIAKNKQNFLIAVKT